MNQMRIMLFTLAILFFIPPALSQENNTTENNTAALNLSLTDIEFDETTSEIVVRAVCQGNISDAAVSEIEINLRFTGFYFNEFDRTLNATLNESMEYSMDLPGIVCGKAGITARVGPLGNESNIAVTDDEKSINITIGNENIVQEKKLLAQFVFLANAGIILLIFAGMLVALVGKDKI